MPEDNKSPEKVFPWVKSDKPTTELYANILHPTWTLFDVRLIIGHLRSVEGDPDRGFVVEEVGGLTLAWPHVKILRDMLVEIVANYEKVNGEIKTINLPPATR